MHRIQVVDESFHCLMCIFTGLLVGFFDDAGKVFLIYNDL